MGDIIKSGQQGLTDILNVATAPVAPILGAVREVIQTPEQKAARQQQDLMAQLVQQQMQGTQQDQVNPQIQMAIATKDYGTASKLISQQKQRDKFTSSIQKDSLLTPEHKQLLFDALGSGIDVKSAADLRARLTLGSEAVKRKLEEQAKKPEEAGKITTAQMQAKQALEVTPEKIVDVLKVNQPNLSPDDLKKAAYGEMVNKKLFTGDKGKKDFERFWEGQQIVGNVPKTPGFLEKFANMFKSAPEQQQAQPVQQAKPAQQPQGQIMISPSTGRKFMKKPDGTITEIK